MNLNLIGIYAIVNKEDGCFTTYVGSTRQSFEQRWKTHKSRLRHGKHCNAFLQNAWNKYGEEAFVFEVVEAIKDERKIFIREALWVDFYRIYVPVYNLSLRFGESGCLRHSHTEETKQKIRAAVSGENHYMYGQELPEDTIKKIRNSTIGPKNHFYGRKHSKESKRKQSAAKSGKNSPFYGKHLSEKHRDKIAKAKAKRYPALQNVETGEIISSGVNLTDLCRKRGFSQSGMSLLVRGKCRNYRGWIRL